MESLLNTLAKVGFDAIVNDYVPAIQPDDDCEDDDDYAYLRQHDAVRSRLLGWEPKERTGKDGCFWGPHTISWPDRVPGLKTWAGQSTLAKIIGKHQNRLGVSTERHLFSVIGQIVTSKGEGPSGLDWTTAQDAIDVGFSPSNLGMSIVCSPARELLAIYGLEQLTLVSFAPRECGFILNGTAYKMAIEERSSGYAFRWPYALTPALEVSCHH